MCVIQTIDATTRNMVSPRYRYFSRKHKPRAKRKKCRIIVALLIINHSEGHLREHEALRFFYIPPKKQIAAEQMLHCDFMCITDNLSLFVFYHLMQ